MNVGLISLYGIESIGVRSLSAILRAEGIPTSLVFFKRWINNDIDFPQEKEYELLVELLRTLNVDLVGVSFVSTFFAVAQKITKLVHERLSLPVVWGGIHATVDPERSLSYCDYVCRGEGDYTLLDLVRRFASGQPVEGMPNLSYKKNGQIIHEPLRPLVHDLNVLPFPDYDPAGKFHIEDNRIAQLDPIIQCRELRVLASRGCPFQCSYCYNNILKRLYDGQRFHRIKSPEKVIAEIEYVLKNVQSIKKIKFDDDTFIFNPEWIDEFSKRYKQRIKMPFSILFNPTCFDVSLLQKLHEAGLNRIQAGIQTGSSSVSNLIYQRDLGEEHLKKFALAVRGLKISASYDVILDNPLMTTEDKEKTVEILLSLPSPFDLFLYSLTVFPGTELCALFLKKGLIREEDIEGNAHKSFYQFRLSFSYPRSKEELFWVCIISLTSKSFIPRSFIRILKKSVFLRRHPCALKLFAETCNIFKIGVIGIRMLARNDLGLLKMIEYGLPQRFIIQ